MRLGWTLLVLGWLLALGGGWAAHRVQTSGGIEVQDIVFPAPDGALLSGLLYVPPTASAGGRAPAVLLSHGYINTREMQSPFAIELARRGFVVLAMDMSGHGHSAGTVGAYAFGGPAALDHLRGLSMVDPENIGLAGHSLGGRRCCSPPRPLRRATEPWLWSARPPAFSARPPPTVRLFRETWRSYSVNTTSFPN